MFGFRTFHCCSISTLNTVVATFTGVHGQTTLISLVSWYIELNSIKGTDVSEYGWNADRLVPQQNPAGTVRVFHYKYKSGVNESYRSVSGEEDIWVFRCWWTCHWGKVSSQQVKLDIVDCFLKGARNTITFILLLTPSQTALSTHNNINVYKDPQNHRNLSWYAPEIQTQGFH